MTAPREWPVESRRRWLREFLSCPDKKRRYHGAWDDICEIGAEIVEARLTESGVRSSLRYVFYRLVSLGYLRNTLPEYTNLSTSSAQARRDGRFPRLVDHNREIFRPFHWESFEEAMRWASDRPIDRDHGQPYALFVVVEKSTVAESVKVWLRPYGIPIVSLRGYSSQTLIDEVTDEADDEADDEIAEVAAEVLGWNPDDQRPRILFTIGDFDPSGENLMAVFIDRTDCWDEVIQVGVSFEQALDLPVQPPAKKTDTRLEKFTEKYWPEAYERICRDMRDRTQEQRLVKFAEIACQVEVEALEANATDSDPEPLRTLLMDAIEPYWSEEAAAEQLAREERLQEILRELASREEDEVAEWLGVA